MLVGRNRHSPGRSNLEQSFHMWPRLQPPNIFQGPRAVRGRVRLCRLFRLGWRQFDSRRYLSGYLPKRMPVAA